MKILITNDDGIHSPGLRAAVEALREAGEIFVVAPDREQSGVGASLTLHAPIRAIEVPPMVEGNTNGVRAYSVEGTPGDCCVLALERLVGRVDLVVSGINQGSNLGEDILVSGTVGAALHGYVRGYPSVAISVAAVKDTRYDVAAAFLRMMGRRLRDGAMLGQSLLNVNIPNEPSTAIEGVKVTRLGRSSYQESVKAGDDGRRGYYWISRDRPATRGPEEDTDIWALRHKNISITPLHTGLTDLGQIPVLEGLFQDYSRELLGRES